MRFCIITLLLLFLAGCNKAALFPTSGTTILNATCYMDGFKGFPKKVTGPVTMQLKSFLTIRVDNEDKTESIEMTFPKSKCKVK